MNPLRILKKVDVGRNGEMFLSEGKKHKLVEDIDFGHFKSFLDRYLK